MNHHITSVVAALLACAATAVPADVASAQQRPEPGAFLPTTTVQGPCFMGGLWDEHAAGPPPVCVRRVGPLVSRVRARSQGACFVSAPAYWQIEAMGSLPACSAQKDR